MNGYTGERILTVSQFNAVSKMVLENEPLLKGVTLTGELSGVKRYPSGHIYFTLKDESASLSCVMFSSSAATLRFAPADGMQVKLKGGATVYERDGRYQFIARSMESDGAGGLFAAYEKLKNKLEKQGLFDERRKKAIPSFPRRIGVITSPTGAAVRDMIQILGRRFPAARVILYPALVQGAAAPESLRQGLRVFARAIPVDLIIIGRGGGSAEDLWAFNDEALARDVAASPVPVISAVGHETDFTICDFVADLRAPTPSAAAELAVPDAAELQQGLSAMEERLYSLLNARLKETRARVDRFASAAVLRSPRRYLDERAMTVAFLEKRLTHAADAAAERARTDFGALSAKLSALNPLSVLARGYAAVFDQENKPVTEAGRLTVGQELHVRLADGIADAVVTGIRESEK